MKQCRVCNAIKSNDEFAVNYNYKDGRSNTCKLCCNKRQREAREAYCKDTPVKRTLEYRASYYKRNRQRLLEQARKRNAAIKKIITSARLHKECKYCRCYSKDQCETM